LNHNHPLLLWLPVVAYMAAIFYTSSLSDVPGTAGVSDTLLHTVGYGGLSLVTLRAVAGGRWSGVTAPALAIAWVIATAYGASDEWHQSYTEGRASEVRDVVNDAVGALVALGAAGAWGIMRRVPRVR